MRGRLGRRVHGAMAKGRTINLVLK